MKAVRIVQVVLTLLLVLYLWLFHSANPVLVELPLTRIFLPRVPVSLVVILALVLGWLIGFVPTAFANWRRSRDVKRLTKELGEARAALENSDYLRPTAYAFEPEVAVIPDRNTHFDSEPDDTTA